MNMNASQWIARLAALLLGLCIISALMGLLGVIWGGSEHFFKICLSMFLISGTGAIIGTGIATLLDT